MSVLTSDDAARVLQALEEKLEELDDQIRRLTVEREEVARGVSAVRHLAPSTSEQHSVEVPKTKEAILMVLDGFTTWASISDIREELDRRGWLEGSKAPDATIRAALRRMLEEDPAPVGNKQRGRNVVYRRTFGARSLVWEPATSREGV